MFREQRIEHLLSQGYTPEEAELVVRVVDASVADYRRAISTRHCACGATLRRTARGVECTRCDFAHAHAA